MDDDPLKIDDPRLLRTVRAGWARQHFSQVLLWAQHGPVAIQRHGPIVATVWGVPTKAVFERERQLAFLMHYQPALQRLLYHYRIAMRLLLLNEEQAAQLVRAARAELTNPGASLQYPRAQAVRWSGVLALPRVKLAMAIVDEKDEGHTLRQRSPLLTADSSTHFNEMQEFNYRRWQAEQREQAKARALVQARRNMGTDR